LAMAAPIPREAPVIIAVLFM
jgi:hypothetical protein